MSFKVQRYIQGTLQPLTRRVRPAYSPNQSTTRIEIIEIENDIITHLSSIYIYQSAYSCRLIMRYVSFQPIVYDLI